MVRSVARVLALGAAIVACAADRPAMEATVAPRARVEAPPPPDASLETSAPPLRDASIEAASDASPRLVLTPGEGTCEVDDDCTIGASGKGECHSLGCGRTARSLTLQRKWRRELDARCGPRVDPIPCPISIPTPRARCAQGRCAAELEAVELW